MLAYTHEKHKKKHSFCCFFFFAVPAAVAAVFGAFAAVLLLLLCCCFCCCFCYSAGDFASLLRLLLLLLLLRLRSRENTSDMQSKVFLNLKRETEARSKKKNQGRSKTNRGRKKPMRHWTTLRWTPLRWTALCWTAPPNRWNSHKITQEAQTPTLSHGLEPRPQFHDKAPGERRKNDICGAKGEKSSKCLAPPFGPLPFKLPLFLSWEPLFVFFLLLFGPC